MPEHDSDFDAIMRTDRFVDALASGARMSSVDPLSAMLGSWRDDVRNRPDAHVVTVEQAAAVLAKARKPARRNRIGLTVVGAAAAAALIVGGVAVVGFDTLFGQSTQTRSDAVTLAAQELQQVQQLVDEGRWNEAQQKLATLGPTVQNISDAPSQQQLVEQYNALTYKVIEQDPQATLPPSGDPLPALPSGPLTFLAPPVIAATTTSSIPSPTATSPLPTPSSPLPTPTTSVGPLPTPTTSVGPLPTPTTTVSPLPTPTAPKPTPTAPQPTPSIPATVASTVASPTPAPAPPPPPASPSASPPPSVPATVAPPQPTPAAPSPSPDAPASTAPVPTTSQAPKGPTVR